LNIVNVAQGITANILKKSLAEEKRGKGEKEDFI
jgi:hypothetical protein